MERELVLIADDHPGHRRLLRDYLSPYYRIVEAEDGREALELLKTHTPALLVLDVHMPQVTTELHARCGSVLAGVGAPDGLLAKPLGQTELLAAVATVRRRAQGHIAMGSLASS